MKILCEKIINTKTFCGTVDIISGLDDFESKAKFNKEFHTYKLNNKILPSVTQLLEDDSYLNVDKSVLEYARDKGLIVHSEIEKWLLYGESGFTAELQEFIRLFNDNLDLFKQKAIFDIKTYSQLTKANKEKAYKQCDMYSQGIKHLTGKEVKDYYVIWLPKDKKGKIIKLEGK